MDFLKLQDIVKLRIITLLFCAITLNSCLEEGDAFPNTFPEEQLMLGTTALPALLNESQTCFDFVFPIRLQTNQNNFVTISNENDLNSFINSQSNSFHTTAIVIPFEIAINNEVKTVNISSEYDNLVSDCSLQTISDISRKFNDDCITITFPIELTNNNETFIINSDTELVDHLTSFQNSQINYPITVKEKLELSPIEVNNDFELFQSLNNCIVNKECSNYIVELTPLTENIQSDSYIVATRIINDELFIDVDLREQLRYRWSVDGMERPNLTGPNAVITVTENGIYEVCVITRLDDCPEVKECTTLVVNTTLFSDECDDLQIDTLNLGDNEYLFTIPEAFQERYSSFAWEVNDSLQNQNTNNFSFDGFAPGFYFICVTGVGDECQQNNDLACVEIEIQ